MSREKILITGGTGFIGSYVVEKLILKAIKPVVLTRNLKRQNYSKLNKKVNLVEMDLQNERSLKNFILEYRPQKIIHLAGSADKGENQAGTLDKFNFEATARLLEISGLAKVNRIIITGTADEYGFQACPQTETMKAMPVSEYAVSKNKAVNYALTLYEKEKLPVVILRPFTIYGTGQPVKMFVSQAVYCAVKGIPFEMSEGKQKRDLLFVSDLADAIMKALTKENIEGEIFNVGSGNAVALRQLAEKIWKIAGADEKLLKIGARFTKENELHDTQADIAKIKRILNWQPRISLEEGLKNIINKAKEEFE
jgi:UDP-glucose 4-epimerase